MEATFCQIKSSTTGQLMPIDCAAWRRDYQYRMDSNGEPLFQYIGVVNVSVTDDSAEVKAVAKSQTQAVAPRRTSGCGCRRNK